MKTINSILFAVLTIVSLSSCRKEAIPTPSSINSSFFYNNKNWIHGSILLNNVSTHDFCTNKTASLKLTGEAQGPDSPTLTHWSTVAGELPTTAQFNCNDLNMKVILLESDGITQVNPGTQFGYVDGSCNVTITDTSTQLLTKGYYIKVYSTTLPGGASNPVMDMYSGTKQMSINPLVLSCNP